MDEAVGEKYLLLNVLSPEEVAALKLLCASTDPDYSDWTNAIDALTTKVETFYEPVAYEEATGFGPGQWVANTGSSSVIGFSGDTADGAKFFGIGDLAKITHDDSAVDSYALSANGPGVGYVTPSAMTAMIPPTADCRSVCMLSVSARLCIGRDQGSLFQQPTG